MSNFYGGREGRSFIITKSFTSVKEMIENFKLGPSYTEVRFEEHVMINTPNKANPENGQIFRRGYDFDSTRTIKTYNLKREGATKEETFIVETVPAGGAIYVGTIAGPAGRAPRFQLDTMSNVELLKRCGTIDLTKDNANYPNISTIQKYLNNFTSDFPNMNVPVSLLQANEGKYPVLLKGEQEDLIEGKDFIWLNYVEVTVLRSEQPTQYYFYRDGNIHELEDSIGWYLLDTELIIPNGEYSVANTNLVPGVIYNGTTTSNGKVSKVVESKNQAIKWAYCSIRNENNEDTIAYVGFQIPYTIVEFEAESTSAYTNRSNSTHSFNNYNLIEEKLTEPFYTKWNIKVPKGIKGGQIENVRVITATSSVVAFDLNNGAFKRNSDSKIATKAYSGRDDDVNNSRKIIVYDYIDYDRVEAGDRYTIYLGDFNMLVEEDNEKAINFANDGTVKIHYTHDNTVTYSKLIDWITDVSFADDGTVEVTFNNDSILSGKLSKPKLINWMKSLDLNADNGKLTATFNNTNIPAIDKSLTWVKNVAIDTEGTVTYTKTTGTTTDSKKINWVKSCTFNNDTGAFAMTFNNDNISDISKTLNYIKETKRDSNGHLLITHSDPNKGTVDLGGLVYVMTGAEGDSDLKTKQDMLPELGLWFVTETI